MMHEPVLAVPGLEIVVFQWSREHGECSECGLPAAFRSGPRKLCAVCAASYAADGERIARISPENEEEP